MQDTPGELVVRKTLTPGELDAPYQAVFGDVSKIIDAARDSVVRSVNASMTAAYWLTGRCVVEFEQSGEERAEYGAVLIERLGGGLDRAVWTRFLSPEHSEHAPVLPNIPTRPDSPDTVWQNRYRLRPSGLRRSSLGLSTALVGLREAAVGEE